MFFSVDLSLVFCSLDPCCNSSGILTIRNTSTGFKIYDLGNTRGTLGN